MTLNLNPNDIIIFESTGNKAVMSTLNSCTYEYYQALTNTLKEWESAADNEAYNNL